MCGAEQPWHLVALVCHATRSPLDTHPTPIHMSTGAFVSCNHIDRGLYRFIGCSEATWRPLGLAYCAGPTISSLQVGKQEPAAHTLLALLVSLNFHRVESQPGSQLLLREPARVPTNGNAFSYLNRVTIPSDLDRCLCEPEPPDPWQNPSCSGAGGVCP
jgi:hypothetical protein